MRTKCQIAKLIAIAAFFALYSVNSYAQGHLFKPAVNYGEYYNLFKNPNVKIARNVQEFATMARTDSQLKLIFDPQTLNAFMAKLKMSRDGLVAFSYEPIVRKYPNNFKAPLALILKGFGWSSIDDLTLDYEGYYCESAGTCRRQSNSICIGENCK
jgi:hypothetical protein